MADSQWGAEQTGGLRDTTVDTFLLWRGCARFVLFPQSHVPLSVVDWARVLPSDCDFHLAGTAGWAGGATLLYFGRWDKGTDVPLILESRA